MKSETESAAPGTEAASPPERGVKCARCNEQMYYSDDPRSEPEVVVTIEVRDGDYSHKNDDGDTLYIHARCWKGLPALIRVADAAAPPPEQARRLAEKAAEEILDKFWVFADDAGDAVTRPHEELQATIAAIILSAGVAAPEQRRGPSRYRLRNQVDNLIEGVFTGVERQSMPPVKLLALHEAIETALAAAYNSAAPQGDFRAGVVEKLKAEVLPNPDGWTTRAYWNAGVRKCITIIESLTDSAAKETE